MDSRAVLALENGMLFEGTAIGGNGLVAGEVVFNTSMTGYQEILTDPSYARQIITLTHPHIGNTGVNLEDDESREVWASGLIIRDLPMLASSWRSELSLRDYLISRNVVAIAEIDTRKLTGVLRDHGSQKGAIVAADNLSEKEISEAFKAARGFPGLEGMDLAKVVTASAAYEWQEGSWEIEAGYSYFAQSDFHVVAYDFGVKKNILRLMVDRGCKVTVVPAETPSSEVLAMNPHGVFLSNGPGDPLPCDYAIQAISEILKTRTPVFGICLGLQLLGLALGMKTKKMGHGHHGANHPVQNLEDNTVMITSQNHGFCLDEVLLPGAMKITHRSLFDGTIQGIHLLDQPAFGFQGHPEASPGPHDAGPLFDHFIELMKEYKEQNAEKN